MNRTLSVTASILIAPCQVKLFKHPCYTLLYLPKGTNMIDLYPLLFEPVLKDYIWGGRIL
jgi:hypothetical protein